MSLGSPNNYTLPVVLALLVHGLIALLLFSQWPDFNTKRLPKVPEFISASVIQESKPKPQTQTIKDNKAQQRKKALERKRKKAEERRKKEEKRKKQLAQQKKKHQAKALEKQKRLAAEKKALALKKAKQKALAAKRAKEKKQAEAKKKQAAEAARKKAWQEELLQKKAIEQAERELQQEIAAAMEAQREEEQRREAIATAKRREKIKDDVSNQIKQRIMGVWSYPHGIDASLEVIVRVSLLPTGDVSDVAIVKSSGNQTLDDSVEKAIYAAAPLPVPEDGVVFENEFRRFTMKFRPEDALL